MGNGVFLQETFKFTAMDDHILVRQKKRTNTSHEQKMRMFFEHADTSQDGWLSREEIHKAFEDKEMRHWLAAMDFPDFNTKEKVDKLIDTIDINDDGNVSIDELVHGLAHLKGAARSVDLVDLMREVGQIRMDLT